MANQKTDIEILEEIREYRNNQLKELGDNRVFYTRVMSLQKGENTGKKFYRIIEEYAVGENQSKVRELFYEYDNNTPVLVAILDPEKASIIIPSEISSEEEYQVWLNEIDKEECENWLNELEDIENGIEINITNIKEAAERLRIPQIDGLTEIEIYKKLDEKNRNNKEKERAIDEEKKNEPTIISNEDAKRCGMIGMNAISLEQKVGINGETLRSEIGFSDEQYADIVDIELVPAYKMTQYNGKVYDTPFVPIGIRKDGVRVAFPENVCSPDKSVNNEVTTIDGKDKSVRRERETCIFRFGKKGTSLVINQKQYGMMDASLAYTAKNNDGRVAYDLLTKNEDGKRMTDTESLEAMNQRGGGEYHVKNMLDEVNSHPEGEIKGEKLGPKDANGNPNDFTHQHHLTPDTELDYKGEKKTIAEIAKTPRFNMERVDVFIAQLEEALDKGKSLEEAYNDVEDFANSYVPMKQKDI